MLSHDLSGTEIPFNGLMDIGHPGSRYEHMSIALHVDELRVSRL